MADVRSHFLICTGGGCIASGALDVSEAVRAELKERELAGEVDVVETGCLGPCVQGPVALVYTDGVFYQNIKVDDVPEIVEEHRFKNHIASAKLSEIDTQTTEEYKTKRLKCCKPCTVNIELRSLKSMFNTAVRWDLINKNPFLGLKLVRIPKTYPKYLTKEEIDLLCETSKLKWLKNVLTFAFNTGMRRNEIINLKWEDGNLNKEYLIVRNNETFNTKSKKDRLIPLSKVVVDLLSSLPKYSKYVFTNGPKPKLYPNYVGTLWEILRRRQKLQANILE